MPEIPKTAEIQILAAGEIIEHLPDYGHPNSFSEAELEEMARNYNHDYLRAPLVLDHQTKGPALGWVKSLVKRGKSLFAEVYDLAENLVSEVREGRWGSISPAIDLNFKGQGKLYVKHVSFLGAANPACAGMQQPVLSDKGQLIAYLSETGSHVFCLAPRKLTLEEMAAMPEAQFDFENFNLLETIQDEKEADYINRVISRFQDAVWRVNTSDRTDKADLIRKYTAQLQKAVSKKEGAELSEKNKGGTTMSGENKELEVKLAALDSDNKKLREEKEASDIRLAEMERNMKLQQINTELTALVNAGKLTPAERNLGLDGFLACLPGTTVKLSEKDTTLRDWFLAFLAQRPAVVDLSGRPVIGREDLKSSSAAVLPRGIELADVDQNSLDFAEKVREIQLRDKCTYGEAMQKANVENPGLYDKTVKTKSR